MPTPRDVLEKPPLAELKRAAEGLAIADKRKVSSVIDALEALGPAHLRVLLVTLPENVPSQLARFRWPRLAAFGWPPRRPTHSR